MKDLSKVKLKTAFVQDYNHQLVKMFYFLLPLLEEGWKEDEVYRFVLFMEKNTDQVRNKSFHQIMVLYKNHLNKKKERK